MVYSKCEAKRSLDEHDASAPAYPNRMNSIELLGAITLAVFRATNVRMVCEARDSYLEASFDNASIPEKAMKGQAKDTRARFVIVVLISF